MTLTQDRRTELIGGCPLFRGIDAAGLGAIAGAAIEVDFPADRVIARQGEIGTGFFVVVDGMVRVIRDGAVVARLGPGEFFGELSVLDGGPRVAQVTAEVPTRCLALASWDFERVLREEPGIALAVLRVVAGRLREITADHRT
jgi:CRP-like cAMP-binding protein